MKELKRKQDEEEVRRREEASRYSVGTDKTDGEKSETQSIKSAGNSCYLKKKHKNLCNLRTLPLLL